MKMSTWDNRNRRTAWADLTAEPLTESDQAAYDDEARRAIPVDDAKVDESTITEDDWDRAEGAHERFKALLETKQRIKPSGSVSDLVAEQRR